MNIKIIAGIVVIGAGIALSAVNFVDSNVGPAGMISGIDPEDYLRNFDTTKNAVTFRGDEYNLKPMVDAIIELHGKASIEANKAPWE